MVAEEIATQIVKAFKQGNKLLICGNGGSASMSQHMAAELVNGFENNLVPPLPAISLTTDTSILTSIGNDIGFEHIFSRQIEALGKPGDILLAISTSGRSPNYKYAKVRARSLGLQVIDFPRKGKTTAKIQEYQLVLMHDICRLIGEAYK